MALPLEEKDVERVTLSLELRLSLIEDDALGEVDEDELTDSLALGEGEVLPDGDEEVLTDSLILADGEGLADWVRERVWDTLGLRETEYPHTPVIGLHVALLEL